MIDFKLQMDMSICILHPVSDDARDWVANYLPEDIQRHGTGVVIEPRYLSTILVGIHGSCLVLEAY